MSSATFCPITLRPLEDGQAYSREGLRSLHPRLQQLAPLPLTHDDQLREARLRADKMSIQGIQPKLSAVLKVKDGRFEIVDQGGKFILKPNPTLFEEVPANEHVTMSMAAAAGIDVPVHGLVPAIDGSWVYFIKRFDREGRRDKIPVEDFAQLSGATRDTKYNSSLEKVAKIVEDYSTFPAVEKLKLAKRLLFCFLTGNEDMHLKNFALISGDGVNALSPAYDLLNTTLVLEKAVEESALPLDGKKNNLTRKQWIDYFCRDRLGLRSNQTNQLLKAFANALPQWHHLLEHCFLSEDRKQTYRQLLKDRCKRLDLPE